MLKQLSVCIALLACGNLVAQQAKDENRNEGKIIFEEVVRFEINLEGEMAELAKGLPKERRNQKVLIFNDEASLFENHKETENENLSVNSGGAHMEIKMVQPDNKLFVDLKKMQKIEQREFMTRLFLVQDEVDKEGWKLTGELTTILDYPCRQAIREDAEGNITEAWFTPNIPVPSGPGGNVGLPGMVLKVVTGEGDRVITAKKIEFMALEKGALKKPKKGKKVNQEEYDRIVAEKMKEMGAEGGEGGAGTFMIKIER